MFLDKVYTGLLWLHIVGGLIALISGYLALFVKRGGKRHRQSGNIYVYAMLVVVVSAFIMCVLRPNPFLFGIAVFSGYFVYTGRSAALNRAGNVLRSDFMAASILLVTAITSLALIAFVKFYKVPFSTTFLITGCVFALIGLFISSNDIRKLRAGPIRGKDRLIKHLVAMCAGLIATTTAVMVTLISNFPSVPDIIAWLGPTVVLVPVIFYWAHQVKAGTFK